MKKQDLPPIPQPPSSTNQECPRVAATMFAPKKSSSGSKPTSSKSKQNKVTTKRGRSSSSESNDPPPKRGRPRKNAPPRETATGNHDPPTKVPRTTTSTTSKKNRKPKKSSGSGSVQSESAQSIRMSTDKRTVCFATRNGHMLRHIFEVIKGFSEVIMTFYDHGMYIMSMYDSRSVQMRLFLEAQWFDFYSVKYLEGEVCVEIGIRTEGELLLWMKQCNQVGDVIKFSQERESGKLQWMIENSRVNRAIKLWLQPVNIEPFFFTETNDRIRRIVRLASSEFHSMLKMCPKNSQYDNIGILSDKSKLSIVACANSTQSSIECVLKGSNVATCSNEKLQSSNKEFQIIQLFADHFGKSGIVKSTKRGRTPNFPMQHKTASIILQESDGENESSDEESKSSKDSGDESSDMEEPNEVADILSPSKSENSKNETGVCVLNNLVSSASAEILNNEQVDSVSSEYRAFFPTKMMSVIAKSKKISNHLCLVIPEENDPISIVYNIPIHRVNVPTYLPAPSSTSIMRKTNPTSSSPAGHSFVPVAAGKSELRFSILPMVDYEIPEHNVFENSDVVFEETSDKEEENEGGLLQNEPATPNPTNPETNLQDTPNLGTAHRDMDVEPIRLDSLF